MFEFWSADILDMSLTQIVLLGAWFFFFSLSMLMNSDRIKIVE